MNLNKVVSRRKKRLGRGHGSGKGAHTVGRGQKGQKARGSMGILFEGVKMRKSLLRRLPFKRGKAKFTGHPKAVSVKTDALNKLSGKVTLETLIDSEIVGKDAIKYGVKILAGGPVTKKLEVLLPTSESAAKIIEKAGGKVS